MSNSEKCLNPLNPNCKNTDITVYIEIDGAEEIPICRSCWDFLAENAEWGEEGVKLVGEATLTVPKINDDGKINRSPWNDQINLVKLVDAVTMEQPVKG